MGEIVNLKLARKRKARTDKDDRAAAALEGHRREPDSGK